MPPCLSKLLEISSAPMCICAEVRPFVDRRGARFDELRVLAGLRNGFYAFESALHVFPSCNCCYDMTFERWNKSDTWKNAYGGVADRLWCFAEDIFGEQFAVLGDAVVRFNSETGEVREQANTLEDWACQILTEYELLTGFPFAHEWQERSGALPVGQRLAPRIPFVLGGSYELSNFYAADAVSAMRFRGDIYQQIRHLPDGARVRLKVER